MLRVSNVSAVYPGAGAAESAAHVLEDISFNAAAGERIALIGANGAGKSTLLLTLVGVIPLHGGSITINGTPLEKKSLPAIRRMAGLVFQNPDDQLFMPTVFEDIAFGLRNYAGRDRRTRGARSPFAPEGNQEPAHAGEVAEQVDALLTSLGIAQLRDRMSHKLSGGEKRMAALASVLVLDPSLLLLDEPSAFLDPRARRRLIGALDALPQAFILATHDLSLARDLCSRVILLKKGRIRADGATKGILGDAALLDECGL
jgi:cobalt/nickel transport system ATP-binding protein